MCTSCKVPHLCSLGMPRALIPREVSHLHDNSVARNAANVGCAATGVHNVDVCRYSNHAAHTSLHIPFPVGMVGTSVGIPGGFANNSLQRMDRGVGFFQASKTVYNIAQLRFSDMIGTLHAATQCHGQCKPSNSVYQAVCAVSCCTSIVRCSPGPTLTQ